MNPNENDIRDLAYQIWESEGRPHGQAARHWEIACKMRSDTGHPRQASASIPDSLHGSAVTQQQAGTKPAGKTTRKSKSVSAPQMN